MLTDLDLAYALSLGLVFWGGEEIKDAYLKFGIDLAQLAVADSGDARGGV